MLSRRYKLTGNKDFQRVEEEGRIFQSRNFGVAIFDRHDDNPTRMGFVVSTKITKAAVDRNLAKRKMSEAVRVNMVDIKSGFDVVFLAKMTITRVPTEDIMREVKIALKDSGLMK